METTNNIIVDETEVERKSLDVYCKELFKMTDDVLDKFLSNNGDLSDVNLSEFYGKVLSYLIYNKGKLGWTVADFLQPRIDKPEVYVKYYNITRYNFLKENYNKLLTLDDDLFDYLVVLVDNPKYTAVKEFPEVKLYDIFTINHDGLEYYIIIKSFHQLEAGLLSNGYEFVRNTDTEYIYYKRN